MFYHDKAYDHAWGVGGSGSGFGQAGCRRAGGRSVGSVRFGEGDGGEGVFFAARRDMCGSPELFLLSIVSGVVYPLGQARGWARRHAR